MYRHLILSLILTIFYSATCDAQNLSKTQSWESIESAIQQKKGLLEIQKQITSLQIKAIRADNQVEHARLLYYSMLIQDQRSEDSLYFRNSAIIDSLLLNPTSSTKLKTLLHLLQAKRINNFRNKYLKFKQDRYETPDLAMNYAAYSRIELDSLISHHFKSALRGAGSLATDENELLWMSSYRDVFLFKPTFSDVVIAEEIGSLILNQNSEGLPLNQVVNWIDLPSKRFSALLDSLTQTKKEEYLILKAYRNWLTNTKKDKEKTAFIETIAKKHLYLSSSYDSVVQNKYEGYLRQGVKSIFPMVRAHSVYHLCLILNEQGSRYEYNFDSLYSEQQFEALKLYQDHKSLISSYPSLEPDLIGMEKRILAPSLQVTLNENQIPDSTIRLHVKYKNLPKLYYRLIKTKRSEKSYFQDFDAKKQAEKKALLLEGALFDDEFGLPLPPDHNQHAVFLKLKSLKAGNYHLLFSDQPIASAGLDFDFVEFDVSRIAVINRDERLFVLDRASGQPLHGAKIMSFYPGLKNKDGKQSTPQQIIQHKTNKDGFTVVDRNKVNYAVISYDGDTTKYFFGNTETDRPTALFDKDRFDNLSDYHDEYTRLHIFTDRGIYRPGQTVFYKAVLLSRDPKTGEMVIFNKRNVKSGLFNNVYQKWLKENGPELHLMDPLRRKIDSVKMILDAYGAFSGSFKIPKTASTGQWNIEAGYIENDNNNPGSFQVEEYKRPSMELSLEKPKEMLLPGKTFIMKIKAKAFSGANLNNTAVKISINRSGYIPQNAMSFGNRKYNEMTLIDSLMYTNEEGELMITVTDSALIAYQFENGKEWTFTYACEFIATDNTGESVTLEDRLLVSSLPINIKVKSEQVYDRQAIPAIAVTTDANLVGPLRRVVKFQIYKLPPPSDAVDDGLKVDQGNKSMASPVSSKKELVYETSINTGSNEKLQIPKEIIPAGSYEITGMVEEEGKILGKSTSTFDIFDSQLHEVPESKKSFAYLLSNHVKPGDKVQFYSGAVDSTYSIYELHYYSKSRSGLNIRHNYSIRQQGKGLQEFEFQIPKDAVDQLLLTKVYVLNNQVYKSFQILYVTKQVSASPEITTANYRRALVPGSKQSFSVSIKTKDQHVAAQLMSVMYDASLDKLQGHKWSIPELGKEFNYIPIGWPDNISPLTSSSLINARTLLNQYINVSGMLSGRVAGLSIGNDADMALHEVVVGYGLQRAYTGRATAIRIRGNTSLTDYQQPLIILDGTVYTGNLSDINSATISEIMVLKDAEASQIYGARAAAGVLVISTKGPITLPEPKTEPVVKIRKNFNETAFFFPKMYADKNGNYTINFTMPESVTEWNWKMLAHTKDTRFAYAERKLYTQLSLMVQPHVPRLLYQGDKIKLQSRITNLDSLAIVGAITCTVEDAVTGEDLTAEVLTGNSNPFSIAKKLNATAAFSLNVPAKQINPLKIIIKASTSNFSDAEEHIIPVMSNRVFVKQSVPVRLDALAIQLKPLKLPVDAEVYGVALSIDAKPQATLVNALPWLANYNFNCAEQTFNKLLAHKTAVDLMRTDKYAQSAFLLAKESQEEEKPETEKLPVELERMELPWLKLDQKNNTQQKQLFNLLDTITTKAKIDTYLQRLYKLQNSDGGISWFEGGRTDQYISAYILAGFGKLGGTGWKPAANLQEKQNAFINQLVAFYDAQSLKSNSLKIYRSDLFGLYARSFWTAAFKLSETSSGIVLNYLSENWKKVNELSLSDQALLILNTYRYTNVGDPLRKQVSVHIKNLRQLAIEDYEYGIRWKDIADSDDLNNTAEETVALLSEAFEMEGSEHALNAGLLKWLLTSRTDHSWATTKATAAAIELLRKEKQSVVGAPKTLSATLAGKPLSVSDDLLTGSPYAFMRTTELPASLTVKRATEQLTTGALTWYYFTANTNQDSLNQHIKLRKQLYRLNAVKAWIPVDPSEVLKVGEKVRVMLTIQTSKALKYVYIDDKRAAAFEPSENTSGYEYGKGISYYKSLRDTGMQIFAESITSGKSEISYELIVSQEGTFYNAPSVLQCMYQPAVTAYSNTMIINTEK